MDPVTQRIVRTAVLYAGAKIATMALIRYAIRQSLKEYEQDQAA